MTYMLPDEEGRVFRVRDKLHKGLSQEGEAGTGPWHTCVWWSTAALCSPVLSL